jgi:hypothetical protein
MYIFMPLIWLPSIIYLGLLDLPFAAIAITLVLGYLEDLIQGFFEILKEERDDFKCVAWVEYRNVA